MFSEMSVLEIIIRAVTGAVIGAGCSFAAAWLAGWLLKRREKELTREKGEKAICLATAAVIGALCGVFVPTAVRIVYVFIMLILAEAVTITDLHHRIIPNDIVIAVIVLAAAFGVPYMLGQEMFPVFRIIASLIGLAVCFVIFMLPAAFSKKVGAGDVKLAAAVGFALGFRGGLAAIVLMGVFVLGFAFVQKRIPTLGFIKSMIPMGPFISVAMVLVLIFSNLPVLAAIL